MDSAFEKAIWKCMSYQPTDEREDQENLIVPGKLDSIRKGDA